MARKKHELANIDLELVKDLAVEGWTDEMIAKYIGCSLRTWVSIKTVNPAFSQQVWEWKRMGRKNGDWKKLATLAIEEEHFLKAIPHVERQVRKGYNAEGKSFETVTEKHVRGSVIAQEKWLNRDPEWRKAQSEQKTQIFDPSTMTDAQLMQLKKSLSDNMKRIDVIYDPISNTVKDNVTIENQD